VYEKMDDSKGSLSPEKVQGGKKSSNEQKSSNEKKSSNDLGDNISPVFGKRLLLSNTEYNFLRKLQKHKFTSDKINDEICKHILN